MSIQLAKSRKRLNKIFSYAFLGDRQLSSHHFFLLFMDAADTHSLMLVARIDTMLVMARRNKNYPIGEA